MKLVHRSGKRKEATAKATLKPGKGIITINSQNLSYYSNEIARMRIQEPLIIANNPNNFDIKIRVSGGGWQSQAEAIRLAVARCLVEQSKPLKAKFLEYDRHLLIADTRRKEQRKPNDSKARSMRQKSYR